METNTLRAWRIANGQTLEALSLASGLSISQLSRIERFGTASVASAKAIEKATEGAIRWASIFEGDVT